MSSPRTPTMLVGVVTLRYQRYTISKFAGVVTPRCLRLIISMFVGVVTLRYQPYTNNTVFCGADNGVPQLPLL